MKALAGQVAIELRKLADALDVQPDAEIVRPYLYFSCDEKDSFLALARLIPRPLVKRLDTFGEEKYRKIRIEYDSAAMEVSASIYRSLTCQLIEPAKPAIYRCDPILSEEEETAVTA